MKIRGFSFSDTPQKVATKCVVINILSHHLMFWPAKKNCMANTKRYTKKKQNQLPIWQIRDVSQETRSSFKELHSKIEERDQTDYTISDVLPVVIDLANSQLKGKGSKLKDGHIVLDTAAITDWQHLEKFEGTTPEEKINAFLKDMQQQMEKMSSDLTTLKNAGPPDQILKSLKDDINNRNLEVRMLKEQIAGYESTISEINDQLLQIKEKYVELQDPSFVCTLDDDVAEAGLRIKDKLLEQGKIENVSWDQYPNVLANYAIKQLAEKM